MRISTQAEYRNRCKADEERLLQLIFCHFSQRFCGLLNRGGNLGRTGDGPPPKFEVGDGPCIRPPNILTSSVCRMTKKIVAAKMGKRCFSCEEKVVYDS